MLRVIGGLLLLAACSFALFRPFRMPSESMADTLHAGDILAVRTIGISPERNAIVVFRYPVDRKQYFVKRIVGMPGDRLRIVDKNLYVNGQLASEPWATHVTDFTDTYRDNFPSQPTTKLFAGAEKMIRDNVVNGEVVVPPGKYFVLGDSRDNSLDSRYWGFVEAEDIFGRPLFVYATRQGLSLRFL